MSNIRKIAAVAVIGALVLGGCSSSPSGAGDAKVDTSKPLVVGANPTPHAKILEFIKNNLADKEGLKLDIKVYQDYILPNEALAAGDLDANYFQTIPYLKEQQQKHPNYKFTPGKGVHLEPLGLYSNKIKSVKELKDGATIGIINDPTNQKRGLKLLQDNGLLKLPKSGPINIAVIAQAQYNPHNFKFREVDGPALVRTLDDVDAALVNGNFAQLGGKTPKDAIAIEATENNPAANLLVWRDDHSNDPRVKKLEKLLHSDAVRDYIQKTWPDKSVIPVF